MYVWWESLRVRPNSYFRNFFLVAPSPPCSKRFVSFYFSSPFSLRDESMKESLYALAVFASPGSMIDDDLRRGCCGVCEKDRGNLSSSRKSRAAMLILFSLSFICGWRNRIRRLGKTYGTYGTSGLYGTYA